MKVAILLFLSIVFVASDDDRNMTEVEKFLWSQIKMLQEQINISPLNESSCQSDWISYSDQKCFKILNTNGTEAEAKAECSLLDNSTLITIESDSEQDYLNEHLKSYRNIADNVWIGLEYVSSTFQWMDGTQFQYQNWGENAIKDGSNRCVQMSLTVNGLGQWTDDNCNRKYLIACQKRQYREPTVEEQVEQLKIVVENQTIEIGVIKKILENQDKIIQKLEETIIPNLNDEITQLQDENENLQETTIPDLNNQITQLQDEIKSLHETTIPNLKDELSQLHDENKILQGASIPIGFIYTQLPNQSSPQDLFPSLQWSDVTEQYSGLFFRAEGNGSQPFGSYQSANQSRISSVKGSSANFYILDTKSFKYELPDNGWSCNLQSQMSFYHFYLYVTEGEVRPRNTAIRIWERIQ